MRVTLTFIATDNKVLIDGKHRVVRQLKPISTAAVATPEMVKAEVLKNGPISRPTATSNSTVVSFGRR
jgi:hypothetical protein